MKPGWKFGWYRALAVGFATGEVVSFIEEHARALPGWLSAMRRAFSENDVAGVSGPATNLSSGTPKADAIHHLTYYNYSGIDQPTDVDFLPGQNSAYLRNVLIEARRALPTLLQVEPLLGAYLQINGKRQLFDPSVRWQHMSEDSVVLLMRGYFTINKVLGAELPAVRGWSRTIWTLRLLRIPLQPFVRIVKALLSIGRDMHAITLFLRNLPATVPIFAAGSAGQLVGMLFGEGDASCHFLNFELNCPRSLDK